MSEEAYGRIKAEAALELHQSKRGLWERLQGLQSAQRI